MELSSNSNASVTDVHKHNEFCDEVSETSPSESEQEVNKLPVNSPAGDVYMDEKQSPSDDTGLPDEPKLIENGNTEIESESQPKKEKKNVNFPLDSTIIKSYLEPPDPWKNVPNWRTEDLVKAYRCSCERHGTKPLNKILQQLQCIENVGERYEILSLKGERLDLKQCESLEDIFRYVRFRCIDLEATHLDDEMAVAIFEMVEYYESACKLNISFNKGIGPRGWMSCSRLVRKTPCLTFIDARNCDLNERLIPIMGRALRMGCFLQRLHLQSTSLSGRALVILVAALKMNEILKELFLGDNKFMPTDGVQIGNLLKYNHTLELLDLRNNHLQDVGIRHICDGLSEQCLDTGLLTLVLWNNQITFQGMSAINKAVTSAEHLETLNLGHNPITNEGIHVLKDGLLKTKALLKLGLSGTKVSCEGAVALAEVIADNTRLVRLDLQENDIKTAGLMALSLALKVNESITRLDIDRDTKKESGVKDYADQQRRLQKDINSLLERNRDILHKREEELRQLEITNKENARKLEEAARDIENCNEYIPSGDGIHRPKLLCIPHTHNCPEHELDSPVLGDNYFLEACPPVSSVTLSSPTGADLLSPQYCPDPKVTAKKIFSVTRVTSPTNDPGFMVPCRSSVSSDVINSPTQVHPAVRPGTNEAAVIPQLCSPLPNVDLPLLPSTIPLTVNIPAPDTPNSLQKVLEQQTLVSYIQQIVDTSTPRDQQVANCSEPLVDVTNENSNCNNKNDSVTDTSSLIAAPETDCAEICNDENNSNIPTDCTTHLNNSKQCHNNSNDTSTNGSSSGTPQNKLDISDEQKENKSMIDAHTVVVRTVGDCSQSGNVDVGCSDEMVVIETDCDKSNTETSTTTSAEINTLNHSLTDCQQGDNNMLDGTTVSVDVNSSTVTPYLSDSNKHNVDTEPWNTVNQSDIDTDSSIVSQSGKMINNPDFHTNLSLNGLREELANLIDEEGNTVTVSDTQITTGTDETHEMIVSNGLKEQPSPIS